jgi:hypothetical protein
MLQEFVTTAFVDAENLVPNATHALKFLKTFGNDKFFPGVIKEVSPTGPVPRLGFHTQDNSLRLDLLGVGAREYHAQYLGTALASAHTWCE